MNSYGNRRIAESENRINLLDIVPAARNCASNVRLVLEIAGDDFNRLAIDVTAEILHCHLHRDDVARPLNVRIGP